MNLMKPASMCICTKKARNHSIHVILTGAKFENKLKFLLNKRRENSHYKVRIPLTDKTY